jgi:hypothetical protein
MLSIVVAGIGLVLFFFFFLVLYRCVRNPEQNADAWSDSGIEMKPKFALGPWRY